MSNNCPKCGHANRPGAKFCAKCGATLTPAGPSVSAAEVADKAKEAAAKAGAVVGPAAAKAGAAIAPVAKEAAIKGWAGSKRGMSFFARMVTVGGRAAYSEVFGPLPVAHGQVTTPPTTSTVPAVVEPAAILFAISLLAGWLVFTLTGLGRAVAIAVIFVVLLALSWLGIRRPYFTRMTFSGLVERLRRRGQVPQEPIYRFHIAEGTGGQPLDVVMIGERTGRVISQGALVELWGIREPGRNELRTWKVETVDVSGQSVGTLTAPRLIPLTVALFLPAVLILIVWLLTLVL
jgi:hypothetical protein